MKKIVFLLLAILAVQAVAADTYSLVDEKYLPLKHINDPYSHENEDIVDYSFEELDFFMWNSPSFLRWNDGRKVCDSMQIMFGYTSSRCNDLPVRTRYVPEPDVYVLPPITTQATRTTTTSGSVAFTIEDNYYVPRPKTSGDSLLRIYPSYPSYPHVWYPWS